MNEYQSVSTNLEQLSPEQLRDRVIRLEAHVKQLKNIISKNCDVKNNESGTTGSCKRKQKLFNFKKYKRRRIAMKFLYLGWDYHGFAAQEDTMKTIEAELFKALTLTKMVESRQVSNYHRCGRTDKGVSAFSQVISLDVRTNLNEGPGVYEQDGYEGIPDVNSKDEIEYVQILNRVLPSEIKVLAWTPVGKEFSARFSCLQRTYKYYFARGSLNIEKMSIAAQKFLGEHDFRNFCKMDVSNGVTNFKRKVHHISISPLCNQTLHSSYDIIEFTIVATAFLWHQIRCIVAVLFAIGNGQEGANVIDELLDVIKNPCKPQYCMASELPLVLFDCQYQNLHWIYCKENLEMVVHTLQKIWTQYSLKTVMVRSMLDEIANTSFDELRKATRQNDCLVLGVKSNVYKPLLEREVCESLEERVVHFKKRKLNNKI